MNGGDFETLLKINMILSVIPILVGVGVSRILTRQRENRDQLEKLKTHAAVGDAERRHVQEQVKDIKHRVGTLEAKSMESK